MNQSSLFQLFVLISLIDLQEQATPDAIFANLMKSRYLMTAVDRDAFDEMPLKLNIQRMAFYGAYARIFRWPMFRRMGSKE
jgi:hypothetical protein